MFDELLNLLERKIGDNYIAFVDLVVLVNGDSRKELEDKGQQVVSIITNWCKLAKLQISERKTEAILLKNEEIRRTPIGRRGGDRVRKTR